MLFPALATGAIAALIAGSRKMTMALIMGTLHLLGRMTAAFMIPAPTWFAILDLAAAYLTMAWLGGRMVIALA